MLCEQDKRAVEAMVRCNMELNELQTIFPNFSREDIEEVIREVHSDGIEEVQDMHSVSMNCS